VHLYLTPGERGARLHFLEGAGTDEGRNRGPTVGEEPGRRPPGMRALSGRKQRRTVREKEGEEDGGRGMMDEAVKRWKVICMCRWA
jgi:hypothetical protein